MAFTIQPSTRHPEMQNDGMQYDGVRFRAECRLAGKVYARQFGVDVAFGGPMLGEPDVIVAFDALCFAGIAPPTLRVYPVETHIAEKLHAYTVPRARLNSRVKDLPDIALLATVGAVEAGWLRAAIDQTFDFRRTHTVPQKLPSPPDTWEALYAALAKEDLLRWPTLDETFKVVEAFLDPVLAGLSDAHWDPDSWSWSELPLSARSAPRWSGSGSMTSAPVASASVYRAAGLMRRPGLRLLSEL